MARWYKFILRYIGSNYNDFAPIWRERYFALTADLRRTPCEVAAWVKRIGIAAVIVAARQYGALVSLAGHCSGTLADSVGLALDISCNTRLSSYDMRAPSSPLLTRLATGGVIRRYRRKRWKRGYRL